MTQGPTERGSVSRAIRCSAVLALTIVVLAGSASSLGPPRAPARSPLVVAAEYNEMSCTGAGWNNSHLRIGLGDCQAIFGGQYEVNNSAIPNETNGYNFSFSIDWVGEFTPSGQLVRLASPLAPISGRSNSTVRGDEVNLSISQVLNVTNASGQWTPDDTWAGSGPQWNVSNATIGTAMFQMGVQLNVSQFAAANSTENASSSVKFDVGVSDWPWAAKTDELGFMLDSLGAWGSHFTYNETSSTLAEKWNATNRTFISVVFGGAANVTYPSGPGAAASVSEQAGLFTAGIPDRSAVVLVTFGGVVGNYSQVAYDPWVVFSLLPTSISPVPLGPPTSGWPAWVAVSFGLVAAVVGLSLILTIVARNERLRNEGEELVRGMRQAISQGAEPPNRSR